MIPLDEQLHTCIRQYLDICAKRGQPIFENEAQLVNDLVTVFLIEHGGYAPHDLFVERTDK